MIGIYDTKAGFTAESDESNEKAHALNAFLEKNKALNIKGGLVKVSKQGLYITKFPLSDADRVSDSGSWERIEL